MNEPHFENLHRWSRATRGSIVLLLLALAWGCGGSDGPAGPGDGGTTTLDAPTLSSDTNDPLTPLSLNGPPAQRSDLVLEVSAPGDGSQTEPSLTYWPLEPRPDGSYATWVPLHPASPAGGGTLSMRVLATDLVSEPAAFEVAGLDAAPGAFAAYTESLQVVLDLSFARLGTTREAVLTSDWQTELDAELYPYAVAQTVLDDPSHARDLRALLGESADFDQLLGTNARDLDLLDRLIARSGIVDLVHAQAEALRASAQGAGAERMNRRSISINSAAELAAAMTAAGDAAREISPDSATGQLLQTYGIAAGALGLAGGPAATLASAGIGFSLYAYSTFREGQASLYPSSFVAGSLSFDAAPVLYLEDDGTIGSWSNVRVSAQSKGWKLDKVLADLLLQFAGSADAYGTWLTRFGEAGAAGVRDLGTFLTGTQLGNLPIANSGLVEIPAQVWSSIDITGEPWSRGRVVGVPAISIVQDLSYEPEREGIAQLTVETGIGIYGGAAPVLDRVDVEVLAIEVEIIASATRVDPGDIVDLQILVRNALDTGLSWTLSGAATWASGPIENAPGSWTASVQTPNDEGLFPVQVIFESTATGGARSKPGAPVRRAIATINGQSVVVIVEPIDVCLQAGESQQFEATVLGAVNTAVTWSATGPGGAPVAAITSGGRFTAPSTVGTYTVIATSVEDAQAQAFATVEVGSCSCYWSATLSGSPGGSWTGVFGLHAFPDEFGTFSITFTPDAEFGEGATVTINAEDIAPGTTGSFPVAWALAANDRVWIATNNEGDQTSATLEIVESSRDRIVGSVSGMAVTFLEGAEPVYMPFSMSFRSASALSGDPCGAGDE